LHGSVLCVEKGTIKNRSPEEETPVYLQFFKPLGNEDNPSRESLNIGKCSRRLPVINGKPIISRIRHSSVFVAIAITSNLTSRKASVTAWFAADVIDCNTSIINRFEILLNGRVNTVAVAYKYVCAKCNDFLYAIDCLSIERFNRARTRNYYDRLINPKSTLHHSLSFSTKGRESSKSCDAICDRTHKKRQYPCGYCYGSRTRRSQLRRNRSQPEQNRQSSHQL